VLDATGFKRKRYSDLVSDMSVKAKELFGEDTNVTEKSFLGILIRLVAWFLAILWEVAENVYNSAFVSKAEGVQLDRLAPHIGITRHQAAHALWQVEFEGTPGYTITEGTQYETERGVIFELTSDVTLDDQGNGVGEVICSEVGPIGNVMVGEISVFTNPDENVTSVTNTTLLIAGREKETDDELRERFYQSTSKTGASTLDSIRATILNVIGVRSVIIKENVESVEVDGIPANSIAPIVYGGSDQSVAQAIFETKPAGIRSYGSTIVEIADSQGVLHPIGFSRPTLVDVYVRATIQRGVSYPTDGDEQVQSAIVDYFNSLLIGNDVVVSKLITAISKIEGVEDVTVELSTDGETYTTSNIVVADDSAAVTDVDKVVIV
jgi:uncharacterized phage protein gp47/JayE